MKILRVLVVIGFAMAMIFLATTEGVNDRPRPRTSDEERKALFSRIEEESSRSLGSLKRREGEAEIRRKEVQEFEASFRTYGRYI